MLDSLNDISTLDLDANSTNLNLIFNKISDNYQNNLAGIIIFTDGQVNQGSPIQEFYSNNDVPIYVVGVGDTNPMLDIAIQSVNSPPLSVKGEDVNIDVVVSGVNFKWIGGSISQNESENVLASVQTAIDKKCPYIFVSASGGMRMMTNMLSLMQMTRMTVAINELKKNNLPYIVVITSPSTGGLQASIASTGDICIGEKGATMAFAGKRIVQATEKTDLPDDFQTVEWQMKKGQVDMVLERKDITPTIGTLLSILLKKHKSEKIEENDPLVGKPTQETKEAS